MTRPAVSDAAERLYAAQAAYQDDDEANGWTLLAWSEATARTLARPNAWLRHDDQGSGRRRSFDPDRCEPWVLRYLAARAGVRIPAGYTADQIRELIKERPERRVGLDDYIVAAIKAQLTGTKFVTVLTNHGEIGRSTVAVLAIEAPNPAAVTAAIDRAFPWWQQVDLDLLDGPTYAALHALHATYDEVLDDFATYDDVLADPYST